MAGLQDLLLLRELQDQANPVRSAFQSLAHGVSQGIAQAQEEQKKKRLEEEQFAQSLNRLSDAKIKFGDKFDVSMENNVIKLSSKPETVIPQGFQIKGYNAKGEPSYERITPGVENLSFDQQIQARKLARDVAGVRGADKILPAISEAMVSGKTVDEIQDMLRTSGQSTQFSGPIRDAAQSILMSSPAAISEKTMDYIDDELSKGNIVGVQDKLKKLARDTAGTDASRSILGKERTVEFLDEIQNDLDTLERNGIDTNIFTGTLEEINAKIGRVNNPEMRKVATKIIIAMQNYRRSVSGVAFSVPETKEYTLVFPSITRTANFNRANLSALREVLSGDIKNFYSLSMGTDNYNKLFGDGSITAQEQGLSDEEAYQIYLQRKGAK